MVGFIMALLGAIGSGAAAAGGAISAGASAAGGAISAGAANVASAGAGAAKAVGSAAKEGLSSVAQDAGGLARDYVENKVEDRLAGRGLQTPLDIMRGDESPPTAPLGGGNLTKYEADSASALQAQTAQNEPRENPLGAANHLIGQFEDADPDLRMKMAAFEPKKNYLRAGLSSLLNRNDRFGGFRDSMKSQEDEQRDQMIRDHYAEQARKQRSSGERGY